MSEANSPKILCNLVWAAVSEVPLVKPGGAWYNKVPGGEARPEIGDVKVSTGKEDLGKRAAVRDRSKSATLKLNDNNSVAVAA